MRSIWIPKFGSPDVLEVRETPDPTPKEGEVRIRVRASGLNFAEVMARKGMYPDAPKAPFVAGYEVAGTIDAVGKGLDASLVGRRVAALVRFGGHADVICVPERQVFTMPDAMSFEEGAALPVNYLTAYHMLFQVFRLKSGDKILVHMAAGGVGTAALQLARTVPGVETFGTASASKHAYAREHGCDHPIDYRTEDYVAEVKRLTNGRGVDAVFDALGGPDWRKGYEILRPSGQLVSFGWANMSSGETRSILTILSQALKLTRFSPLELMNDNKGVAGVNMGHLWGEVEMIRHQGEALMDLYREGKIRPHVDRVFPFTEAAAAHRHLEQAKNLGKVVLVP